ncbi:MAG: hypothetical protein ACP5GX_00730 [Anaerolineae bacterium]
MPETTSFLNYYFAPLGRERGGLLELLDLPPTAEKSEVARRVRYQMRIHQDEYQARRKLPQAQLEYTQLKARLAEGEITEAAFEEARDEIVARFLEEDIRAKQEYDRVRAEYESGELSEKKYRYRIKKAVTFLEEGKDLLRRRREIPKEEYEARYTAILERLETMEVTSEEIQAQQEAVIEDLEAVELTQEEFDELDKAWQAERTVKETALNEIKAAYDAMRTKERERENKGFTFDTVIWRDVATSAGDESDGPAWIDPEFQKKIVTLVDHLWGELPVGQRTLWRERMRAWRQEVRHLGPIFDTERAFTAEAEPVEAEFPTLAAPFPLSIERLEQEELEEVSLQPQRDARRRQMSVDEIMAAMLREMAERTPEKSVTSSASQKPEIAKHKAKPSAEEFTKFLQKMTNLSKDKKL